MRIIEQSNEIIYPKDIRELLKVVEIAGRTCYKTESCITEDSAGPFVSKIANVYKHKSVLEHANITIRQITNRGVTHELVRHRHTAYSQESSRYCNYIKDKFGSEITVIKPIHITNELIYNEWYNGCLGTEQRYFNMLKLGATTDQAREVLPNSLKTEIIVTTNLREWQHIIELRDVETAHPQMRALMNDLHNKLHKEIPELF